MGQIANVISSSRTISDDGNPIVEVKCDPGGGAIVTAELVQPSGEDALPLPGDFVAVEDGPGHGTKIAIAFSDAKNSGTAGEGERRTYARDSSGAVVAEIWAKATGDITITSVRTGGKINLNGVTIDQQGNITTAGEVMAMSAGPGTGVKLSTHLHPTGTGPSGPPQPGT